VKVDGSTVSANLGRGLGLVAGAGYDIPVGRRVSITPAVDFSYGRPGASSILGTPLADFRQNVIDFTIGITFP
jgi:hypothetical protein